MCFDFSIGLQKKFVTGQEHFSHHIEILSTAHRPGKWNDLLSTILWKDGDIETKLFPIFIKYESAYFIMLSLIIKLKSCVVKE